MNRASILAFRGSWSSGLAFLQLQDLDTGKVESVPCDNGPLVRALDAAFPGFIAPGHVIDNSVIEGEVIDWCYDDLGLCLGGFMPVNEEESQ